MLDILLAFFLSIVASVLSGMAGGGGGLIMTPGLLLLGIPPHTVIGTDKFGAVGLTLGSISSFWKTSYVRWDYVVPLSVLSVSATVFGVELLLRIPENTLHSIIAFIVLLTLPLLFLSRSGLERVRVSVTKRSFGYVLYFFALLFTSAFASGIGLTVMPILMYFMGFTALDASATKRIPGFLSAFTGLIALLFAGKVLIAMGLALMVGKFIGGRIGAAISIKKGNGFVRGVLAITVVAMAMKLLFF